ncbi:MAG: ABC transporter substrate-binding protein [Pseudomonadota bacterium]
MARTSRMAAAALGALLTAAVPAAMGADTPKRGGIFTYMIPADAPPSFDGHRETTYATLDAGAPFYSVLIRVNPDNPGSTRTSPATCAPRCRSRPTDGKTYMFKIRQGVKFHDGAPLTAIDVAASWQRIVRPPEGVSSARESYWSWSTRSRHPTRPPWCSG